MLCDQLMEMEVTAKLGAGKHERTDSRSEYRAGFRPRRFDTRMGTMYLMVPKPRKGGYIPFFVTERKRSEAALMSVIQVNSGCIRHKLLQCLPVAGGINKFLKNIAL